MDKNKEQVNNPGLYLVATPIGNLEDVTIRALNVLKKSNFILCEDTRRSEKLLSYYQIKKKLIPYHKFNEQKISNKIIQSIKEGNIVSLISDAGTPNISDPGAILVNKCIEENINIHPIPGSSAVTSALSTSGFSDKFLFYGFLPKKENELNNILKKISNLDYSIIFFIPSNKFDFYITKFKLHFSDRNILIAKEMTKLHEEFIRCKVVSVGHLPKTIKGELTVVLSQKIEKNNFKKEIDELVRIEIKKMLKKYTHKDVVEFISKKENLPKKLVYDFCLKFK